MIAIVKNDAAAKPPPHGIANCRKSAKRILANANGRLDLDTDNSVRTSLNDEVDVLAVARAMVHD
jgi:hypothetical protein